MTDHAKKLAEKLTIGNTFEKPIKERGETPEKEEEKLDQATALLLKWI